MSDNKRPIVVVADDDRDIYELIKMQLTRHGFEVFIADNGVTALELIAAHQPAVALLDIMMPGLSGLEVARRIRDNPANSNVGIILISARSSGRDNADLDELAIDDYITKPFSLKELVDRINNVITHRQTTESSQP